MKKNTKFHKNEIDIKFFYNHLLNRFHFVQFWQLNQIKFFNFINIISISTNSYFYTNHILTIDLYQLMFCEDAVSGCWWIFNKRFNFTILEHKANETTAVFLHCDCSLKWSGRVKNKELQIRYRTQSMQNFSKTLNNWNWSSKFYDLLRNVFIDINRFSADGEFLRVSVLPD